MSDIEIWNGCHADENVVRWREQRRVGMSVLAHLTSQLHLAGPLVAFFVFLSCSDSCSILPSSYVAVRMMMMTMLMLMTLTMLLLMIMILMLMMLVMGLSQWQ